MLQVCLPVRACTCKSHLQRVHSALDATVHVTFCVPAVAASPCLRPVVLARQPRGLEASIAGGEMRAWGWPSAQCTSPYARAFSRH